MKTSLWRNGLPTRALTVSAEFATTTFLRPLDTIFWVPWGCPGLACLYGNHNQIVSISPCGRMFLWVTFFLILMRKNYCMDTTLGSFSFPNQPMDTLHCLKNISIETSDATPSSLMAIIYGPSLLFLDEKGFVRCIEILACGEAMLPQMFTTIP